MAIWNSLEVNYAYASTTVKQTPHLNDFIMQKLSVKPWN